MRGRLAQYNKQREGHLKDGERIRARTMPPQLREQIQITGASTGTRLKTIEHPVQQRTHIWNSPLMSGTRYVHFTIQMHQSPDCIRKCLSTLPNSFALWQLYATMEFQQCVPLENFHCGKSCQTATFQKQLSKKNNCYFCYYSSFIHFF